MPTHVTVDSVGLEGQFECARKGGEKRRGGDGCGESKQEGDCREKPGEAASQPTAAGQKANQQLDDTGADGK